MLDYASKFLLLVDNLYFGQISDFLAAFNGKQRPIRTVACTNDRFHRLGDLTPGPQITITCGFGETSAGNHPKSPAKSVIRAPTSMTMAQNSKITDRAPQRVKHFYTSEKRVKKIGNSLHVVPNALVVPQTHARARTTPAHAATPW
ncbi:hypothetical protein [uncultured Mobiluncus sp.]|uniref:hypothetical protein n=1 Tax=uncultured Mobiluncus sp. TaxID=293425 RepID=UPI002605CCD8|nr:hypothetical protein [uncultured Mobiluncus sp.]